VLEYYDNSTDGRLLMSMYAPRFSRDFFRERDNRFNALIWNRGQTQTMRVDGMSIELPANSFVSLNVSHSFRIDHAEDMVIWQFNREFYCIVTHDAEVSCTGLLFYSTREGTPIYLDEKETHAMAALVEVFRDEFDQRDNIQGEMLRVLLKRLIIKLTRLVKIQTGATALSITELDTLRQFQLLVENNFKTLHQVKDYANLMFKSPKTLSNLFSKYSDKSPLQIISDRLFLESKRLMLYTELSASEIGYSLGFQEPAHFSRFFKKMAGQTPSAFKVSAKR
jgi:AraC family transcriptional regulator, transcriptional activator of pobA